jgi:hypothetical protein
MNTLKKSMLLLLLACLCACGREENLAAQNKPKQKTVKEALCREWHLDKMQNTDIYTQKDTFGITFYPNHTFILRIDPKKQKGVSYIKGTWKFKNAWEEDYICDSSDDNICTRSTELQLLSDTYIENSGYCLYMFQKDRYSKIGYLNDKELWLKPPLAHYEDQRYFEFSPKK